MASVLASRGSLILYALSIERRLYYNIKLHEAYNVNDIALLISRINSFRVTFEENGCIRVRQKANKLSQSRVPSLANRFSSVDLFYTTYITKQLHNKINTGVTLEDY